LPVVPLFLELFKLKVFFFIFFIAHTKFNLVVLHISVISVECLCIHLICGLKATGHLGLLYAVLFFFSVDLLLEIFNLFAKVKLALFVVFKVCFGDLGTAGLEFVLTCFTLGFLVILLRFQVLDLL